MRKSIAVPVSLVVVALIIVAVVIAVICAIVLWSRKRRKQENQLVELLGCGVHHTNHSRQTDR